jgi:hypothetical protein
MTTEIYRGMRLKAIAGKKDKWGTMDYYVNGQKWGNWMGRDEAKAIEEMKRTVDEAAKNPEAYGDFWTPKDGK